jgi:hypothetical protein
MATPLEGLRRCWGAPDLLVQATPTPAQTVGNEPEGLSEVVIEFAGVLGGVYHYSCRERSKAILTREELNGGLRDSGGNALSVRTIDRFGMADRNNCSYASQMAAGGE